MIKAVEVTKKFSSQVAVNRLSFEIKSGETLALIGPSGCGKTTTLKMINRLLEPTSGEIYINRKSIGSEEPTLLRRHIGYIMQSGGLFPHYTVAQNIAIVPKLLKWNNHRISDRIHELLKLVNLPAEKYLQRYPVELSGGEQQRVGIARALAADPPLVLVDEPFSALDPITRKQLQEEFISMKKKLNKTMVFVTHDLQEAFIMGDNILILNQGKLQQLDTPLNIMKNPSNEFVKTFTESQST